MNSQRIIGIAAVVIPLWFLALYLIMSGMRPEYSHASNAISELGSLDAPNLWAWNIFGYCLPGLVIALLGTGLVREFSPLSSVASIPFVALIASGLFLALSGVFPANMADFESVTTVVHIIGSNGCFVAFLAAGFWLPFCFRKRIAWHWLAWPSLVLVVGSIVSGFLRSGETSGIGQRLTFACFFLWVALIGFALLRSKKSPRSV